MADTLDARRTDELDQEQGDVSDPDPEPSACAPHMVADKQKKDGLRALELQRRQKQQWEWQMRQHQARQVWMVPPELQQSQLEQFQQAVPQHYAHMNMMMPPQQHAEPPQMGVARGLPEGLSPPQIPPRLAAAPYYLPPQLQPPGALPMGVLPGVAQPGMQQRMLPPGMPRMPPGVQPGMQPMQPRLYAPGAQQPETQPRISPPGMQPRGMLPPGMHPAGMHPAGMHPAGMHPAGMHPAGMHPPGMHPPGMLPRGMLPPGGPSQMRPDQPHQPQHQWPMHAAPVQVALANTIMELRQGRATHPADQAPPPSLPVHPSLRTSTHHPCPASTALAVHLRFLASPDPPCPPDLTAPILPPRAYPILGRRRWRTASPLSPTSATLPWEKTRSGVLWGIGWGCLPSGRRQPSLCQHVCTAHPPCPRPPRPPATGPEALFSPGRCQ